MAKPGCFGPRRSMAAFLHKPAFVLFDVGKEGWRGATAFAPDRVNYLENQHGGTLAFRRYD